MMQPTMFAEPYHPVRIDYTMDLRRKCKYRTRTECPPKYFFIDFGLSSIYDRSNGPVLDLPVRGGDKSAPEHSDANYNTPCDPFATDVYYLGNLIREYFIYVSHIFTSLVLSLILCDEPVSQITDSTL